MGNACLVFCVGGFGGLPLQLSTLTEEVLFDTHLTPNDLPLVTCLEPYDMYVQCALRQLSVDAVRER
jgi:hypothetical protein